ncbi:hypothetical protein HYH03_003563 [Edaphochlamys debaryana]|uniref:Jacalin-type lectin domain-containing protein n=1 Tax=Edaphochlamys debaryana TaxID=47281 RepID=A0A835Y8N2_9CHLO|nr:hypothetical protein HYH03_003563 [Edaphochlamys debaryana]|eukprot:KAG2498302.1 hypothetical protein HYH03_003563 [Edaphochlamys debaryana]
MRPWVALAVAALFAVAHAHPGHGGGDGIPPAPSAPSSPSDDLPQCTSSDLVQGNFGGEPGGRAFDDSPLAAGGHRPITRLMATQGDQLYGIGAVYGDLPGPFHGSGAAWYSYKLDDGETVVAAYVAMSDTRIEALYMRTNAGREIFLGSSYYSMWVSATPCAPASGPAPVLIAFAGTSGAWVNNLSLVWAIPGSPAPPSPPSPPALPTGVPPPAPACSDNKLVQGPFGGQGGSYFSWPRKGGPITAIQASYVNQSDSWDYNLMGGLQVYYGGEPAPFVGMASPWAQVHVLAEGEAIIGATVGHRDLIQGMELLTSLGRTLALGAPKAAWQNTAVANPCPSGRAVLVGIQGYAGMAVDGVTLVWSDPAGTPRRPRTPKPPKAPKYPKAPKVPKNPRRPKAPPAPRTCTGTSLTVGPFGSTTGGGPFSDVAYARPGRPISRIAWSGGEYQLTGIQAYYKGVPAPWHGEGGGEVIDLRAGETIVAARVSANPEGGVHGLELTTSRGRTLRLGDTSEYYMEEATPCATLGKPRPVLQAFAGRAGAWLDGLSLVWTIPESASPLPPSPPRRPPSPPLRSPACTESPEGPYGGTGGGYFDDSYDAAKGPITRVAATWEAQPGGLMTGINFAYGFDPAPWRGLGGANFTTIPILKEERIIGVRVGYGKYVQGLVLETTRGRNITLGQVPSRWNTSAVATPCAPAGAKRLPFLAYITGSRGMVLDSIDFEWDMGTQ